MRRKHKSKVFEQLKIVDTATKGKTVAKTPEGMAIFLWPFALVSNPLLNHPNFELRIAGLQEGLTKNRVLCPQAVFSKNSLLIKKV